MSNDWHGVCNQTEFRVLAGYENLFAHTVAVMRLHLSKKDNPLLTYMYISRLVAILFFQLLFPKTLFRVLSDMVNYSQQEIKQKRRCVHPDEKYSWWRSPPEFCEFFHAHFSNKIKFLFINRFSLCYSRSTLLVLFSCFITLTIFSLIAQLQIMR